MIYFVKAVTGDIPAPGVPFPASPTGREALEDDDVEKAEGGARAAWAREPDSRSIARAQLE